MCSLKKVPDPSKPAYWSKNASECYFECFQNQWGGPCVLVFMNMQSSGLMRAQGMRGSGSANEEKQMKKLGY